MEEQERVKKIIRWNLIGLAVLMIAGLAAVFFIDRGGSSGNLGKGLQVYRVMSGGDGPKISEVVIDPLDPKMGKKQSFEVAVSHEKAIDRVTVNLITDSVSSEKTLTLAEGTDTSGIYRGEWIAGDSYEKIYLATIRVFSGEASSSIDLTFR